MRAALTRPPSRRLRRSSCPINLGAMTERYSIDEALARLAELVERAAAGEEIILGDASGARVVLRRYDMPKERRSLGILKGRIAIAEDFDEPSPELMKQLGLTK